MIERVVVRRRAWQPFGTYPEVLGGLPVSRFISRKPANTRVDSRPVLSHNLRGSPLGAQESPAGQIRRPQISPANEAPLLPQPPGRTARGAPSVFEDATHGQ